MYYEHIQRIPKKMLYKSNPIFYCVMTKKLTNLINSPCTIVDEDINYEINLEDNKQRLIQMPQRNAFCSFQLFVYYYHMILIGIISAPSKPVDNEDYISIVMTHVLLVFYRHLPNLLT